MNLGPDREAFSPPEDQTWLGSAHGTSTQKAITLDADQFLGLWPDGVVPSGICLVKSGDFYIPRALQIVDEVQTLTIDATGGTYTITFGGDTTDPIAEAATAAAVQAAMEALDSVDPGDLVVTGAAGGPYTFTWAGQYADENVAQPTTDAALLTGGAGTAVFATTQAGGGESPANVCAGHLFTTKQVKAGAKVGAALYWHGNVIVANLPDNHGWDASVATDLPQIRYSV